MANYQPNLPSHEIFFVKEPRRRNQKGIWTKIGAAWLHEDQAGFSFSFDFLPADPTTGHYVARIRTEKPSPDSDAVDPATGEILETPSQEAQA